MKKKPKSGQVMILTIVALVIILILGSSLFTKTASFIGFNSRSIVNEQATQLAEAGLDYAIQRLNDTAGSFTSDNFTLSTGSVTVTVENKTQNLKTVTATGYIPNSINPRAKRTVKADAGIDSEQVSFNFASQTDTGGLEMYSNATINGTAYTNGNIQGFSNSRINGQAWASGTISSPDPTVSCSTPPCVHPSASPQPLPAFDAGYWKGRAEAGGTIDCSVTPSLCTYNSGSYTLGPSKIQGNLTLNSNAWITLNGAIYVTGNFTMNSNTKLIPNPAFGSNGTVVVVDGTIQLNSNAIVESTNSNPKGYIILASTKTPPGTAIELNSNAKAGVLYALSGNLQINSNGDVVALAANKLIMNSNATLTYDAGLAGATFVSQSGGSWQIKKGTYRRTSSP